MRLVPLLAVIASTAISQNVLAQSGATIRGVITAADTKAPIFSARIAIDQPPRVAIANEKGAYTLRFIPAGTYSVMVSAIGYKPSRNSVTVSAGQSVSLDVTLQQGSLLLSSVVVSATRTPVEAAQVASTVNVLTPQHIQSSPFRESQDLLREIPGVELPRTSSMVGGTAQIVSIRGVDEGRTAVIFDGIPVNDAWGEWIDWGRIPKGMLDRVEVVEGGTASLYGNGAMGGAISFFSRPMAPGSIRAMVEGGSRETRHGFVSAGIPIYGALSANVSGDYQDGGGYTLLDATKRGLIDVPSEIIQRNGYARLTYAPSSKWSAFVTGHKYTDNRNTGTPLSYQTRDQGTGDIGLDYGTYDSGMLGIRAWTGRQDEHQRSGNIRATSASCTPSATIARQCEDSSVVADIPSHDWGASAMWTRTHVAGLESFSLGGDFRHYNGAFDEVDFNTTCPGTSCGRVARTIFSGGDQALSGVFAQAIAAPFSPLRIELSARIDRWDNTNGLAVDASSPNPTIYPDSSKTAFSPRVGARYSLTSNLSVHGAVYKAFRAPNLAELYRKQIAATSITLPNPYLEAENALGREVGVDFQPLDWVQAKGTFYVADYDNFNVPVTLTGSARPAACGTVATCRTRLNVNKSRSEGVEGYVAVRPLPHLFVSGSVNYDDARQQSGLTDTTTKKPHINRVPSPKQVVRATLTTQLLGAWTVLWMHEGHTTTLQGAWLDPYSVVNANVQREILPGLNGFLSVENLGDTKYQVNLSGTGAATLVSFGMPRTVRVGVEAFRY